MQYLPESTRLLYTQLLSACLRSATPSGRGLSFVTKRIKGGTHWYLQVTVGSRKTQHYLGPDSEEVRSLVARERALWAEAKPDLEERERLVAMLIAGGAHAVGPAEARVFELLERVGVFLIGGVLVGSHAFALYGNMLGVEWPTETTRTQDLDIATDTRILVGLPTAPVSLRQALLDSEMGFVEVPALDRKAPSTKFRIKGKELSVDILTPLRGRTTSKPLHIAALDTYAEPVRFLDFLLEDTQPAIITARAGILVNVPAPGRFLMHKLITSRRRSAAMHTKTIKDRTQAEQLLSVLLDDRPGDIRVAWQAAARQPKRFNEQLRAAMHTMPRSLADRLARFVE